MIEMAQVLPCYYWSTRFWYSTEAVLLLQGLCVLQYFSFSLITFVSAEILMYINTLRTGDADLCI